MRDMTGAKKFLLLFVLLLLPTILYLIFLQGKHDFMHLPFVTNTDMDGVEHRVKAPEFGFTDQNGQKITDKDVEGKIRIVDFFFTSCPSICPIMTANLMKINDRFSFYDDLMILSHTVDPAHDTPDVLKEYAEKRKISSHRWHFLTGEKDSLYAVAAHYLSNAREDSLAAGGFLHTEYFVLIDKDGFFRSRKDDDGNIIAVYHGTNAQDMRDLIDDIKVLIAEYNRKLKSHDTDSTDE